MKRSFRTNSRRNATIFGRKWYQILAKSKAKEGDWTVLRKTDLLAVLPTGYGKSLIDQLLFCFLADGLNIFPQALAQDLPYVTFRFTWQTLQTSLQFFSFWTGFFSLFPNVRRSSNFNIYFLTQNNKNRKYENALAPTDFVTKAVAWFWLDNFDSQTFHSWVGFA